MRIRKFVITITTHTDYDRISYKDLACRLEDALKDGIYHSDLARETFYINNAHISKKEPAVFNRRNKP